MSKIDRFSWEISVGDVEESKNGMRMTIEFKMDPNEEMSRMKCLPGIIVD
jgi:hypothetical protein